MSKSKKKYLIRSVGQILGPYSKKEILDLIQISKISVFDEVTEPFSIWRYLQDHQEFKEAIRNLSVQTRLTNFLTNITNKINTVSRDTDSGTKTKPSPEQTNTYTLPHSPKTSSLGQKERKSAKEVDIQGPSETKAPKRSSSEYTSAKDSEEIVRKRVGRIIRVSWQLIIVSALFLGAYIAYKEVISPIQEQKVSKVALESLGLDFYKAGDYERAFPYFKEAYSQNLLSDEEKLWMASLFVEKNRLGEASLILKELSTSSLSKTPDWFLLNGLISLYERDFSSAKADFKSAMEEEPQKTSLNLALLRWSEGDYKATLSQLDELLQRGYERDIVFYLKALSLLYQNQIEDLSSYIHYELAFSQTSSLMKEYKQEMYLILSYLYMKEQKTEEMEKSIRQLLNEDPFFSKEYQYSSFTAVSGLDWKALRPYCQSIFESNPSSDLLNALYGFCHLKIGDAQKGAKYIEQAKNSSSQNPLFLALYIYRMMFEEKDFQLESVFSLIDYENLKKEQTLPYILKARFFEKKADWGQALSTWRKLLAFSEKHLSGMTGVAVSSYQLKDYSTWELYKNMALDEYPYNVRLLSYKEPQLEATEE